MSFHTLLNFNEENRREWVRREAGLLAPGSRVLDAGAGVGQYRSFFDHCEYLTQDFAQEPGTVGKYTQLDYVCDIAAIPVEDASFDAILCTEVIEHVPDPVAVIREFGRILRPGGTLLVAAPLGSFLHQEPYHFYGGYTPYWYEKFLGEIGFQVEEIRKNRGFFSLFGQEARRFSALVDPRRTLGTGLHYPLVLLVWLLTVVPFRLILPLIAPWLDDRNLENIATIGYHVRARRIAIKSGSGPAGG